MTKEETKLMLDRVAQKYNLRVVDADCVQNRLELTDELKMAIQNAYYVNSFTYSQYLAAAYKQLSLNPKESLEFASKGLGLLEANDNILRELNKYNLDVIKCPE